MRTTIDGGGPHSGPYEFGAVALRARRGSILLLVLVVIVVLTVGVGAYLQLMQSEHFATRQHGRMLRARAAAQSGLAYLKVFLSQTPQEIQLQGGIQNNPNAFQAILVDDSSMASQRLRFSVLSPAIGATGQYLGVRFGLEDESTKLSVNSLMADEENAADRLSVLPGMTEAIADSILDWVDEDDQPRAYGAEAPFYESLDPPRTPRNGPIRDLDELLLVQGVTPELLYGLDQNRNFLVDADELPRGALAELDTTSGSMNRGWSAFLTTFSLEKFRTPDDSRKINLNSANLQQLHAQLTEQFDAEMANFIVAFRQFGGSSPAGEGEREGEQGGGRTEGGGRPEGNAVGRGGEDDNEPRISAAELTINFEQQGQAEINSPLDLVGVEVRVQPAGENEGQQPDGGENSGGGGDRGGGGGRSGGGDEQRRRPSGERNQQITGGQEESPKVVESPWSDDAGSYRELLELYDYCMPGNLRRVAGRINVNAASRTALLTIPQVDATLADQILSRRQAVVNPQFDEQRHPIWLLIQGVVDLEFMKQLEPYITAEGHVYSCQIAGFFDASPTAVRLGVVLDRTGRGVRVVDVRDLSGLGPGFTPYQLGAQLDQTGPQAGTSPTP